MEQSKTHRTQAWSESCKPSGLNSGILSLLGAGTHTSLGKAACRQVAEHPPSISYQPFLIAQDYITDQPAICFTQRLVLARNHANGNQALDISKH